MNDADKLHMSEGLAGRLERVGEALAAEMRRAETARGLRAGPGEAEWSALEILGHVVEMIPYWLAHVRTIVAADEPPRFGRTLDSPERLAAVAAVDTLGPGRLVEQLETEVEAAARAIRGMSAEALAKKGLHLRRGEMTAGEVLGEFIVAHAEDHLEQVRAALG
ncbi:MAG TPA: DinB family protein [Anaerolineales bacterium]|nr:DinB family protein [Anaerolineales bacterium]